MTGKFKAGIRVLSVILTALFLIEILPNKVFAQELNEYLAFNAAAGIEVIEEEAEIVSELVSKRDEYTKVFLRSDGTQTAVISGAPLHYEKDGEWADIDSTLEEKTVDGESVLQNKAGAFTVSLPCDLKENNTVSVENKGYTLSFALQSEELMSKTGSVEAQIEEKPVNPAQGSKAYAAADFESKEASVLFESAQKDTDIQYVVTPTGLKENIILNKKPKDAVSYTYTISANGLTGVLNGDNSIEFKDAKGEVIFILPAPFMYDASNELSVDVAVTLAGSGGSYTMTYTPSYAWLSDGKREYPVTVDPVVSLNGSGMVEDTCVISNSPNENRGDSLLGCAANFETPESIDAQMYFKLGEYSQLFENIKITKATLTLTVMGYGAFGVKSIVSPWVEKGEGGVTYNTKPALSTEFLDYIFMEDNEENLESHPICLDLTAHYCNWQSNETDGDFDYGIAIIAVNHADFETTQLYAYMTEASGQLQSLRPVYELTFVEANNMDGVTDTHSFDAGRAGTVCVNDFSRNAYLIRNDISVDGNILPANIFFHHNSNGYKTATNLLYGSVFGNSYGQGWLTSYNRFLDMSFNGLDISGYKNEYGDTTYFKLNTDKTTEELTVFTQINENNIFPSAGTLYFDGVGETCYMEKTDGKREYFDGFGRLIKIEDGSANKNAVLVEYVCSGEEEEGVCFEAISRITDTAGREFRFSYGRVNSPLPEEEDTKAPVIRMISIAVYDKFGDPVTVDGTNGAVPLKYEYGYDSIGELLSVTYPDLTVSSYTYDTNIEGKIACAQGIDGYSINLGYTDAGKVSKVIEKKNTTFGYCLEITGDTVYQNTFTYRYGSSGATPYAREIKQFDKYGRTVSVRDENNKFLGIVYKVEEVDGEEYSFLDSITDEISALGTTANLLGNGDFAAAGSPSTDIWDEQGLSGADSRISSYNLNCHTPFVYRINGSPAAEKFISQTVTPQTAMEKGDVLTLGGWMRANPMMSNGENERFCGFKIKYSYTQTGVNGQPFETDVTESIPFANTNGAWVFNAAEFTLIGSPKNNEITVYAEYTNQCNTAYFADIQLTCTKGEEPLQIPDEEQGEPEPETTKTCPCENCEEYDCSCECESEEVCVCPQCKRRRISETDSNGNSITSGNFDGIKTLQTHNSYTPDGNYLLSSCDAAGNMVQFSYNQDNGVLNAITDGEGSTVSYAYNAMRMLTGVSQLVSGLSNGTSILNTYNYMNDRLTSITHNGFSYNFTYNTWGNLTAVKVNSENLVSYTYGSAENRDRLGKITYGNGNTVNYLYDNEDNITGIKFNNDSALAYEYAYTNGALTSVTDNQSGYVTAYTDGGIKVTKGGVTLFETGYDSEDNYTETSNGTEYTYTYGDGGYDQATGVSTSESAIGTGAAGSISFVSTTDWFGRAASNRMTAVSGSANLGSVSHSYTYKETASTATEYIDTYTSTVTPVSGTKTDTVYRYTYDNNGNIRTITKDGTLQYTYNYDEAGQLVRADDAVQNKSFTYTYDVGGNIVSKKEYAYTTGTLGSVVDTISYTYDGTWKDKLTSYNGKSISYDAIGNPLSYDGNTFDWNGRILNGISNSTKSLTFKYNENGLRTEKAVTQGGTTTTYNYIWNGDKLVSQSDGTNTFYFFYNNSNYAPDGFVLNGTDTYFYTKNLQGDVTDIADANGIIVTTYTYDVWGNIISVTGTQAATIGAANPFRYRGYYYDTETELYYLQSRYYNPDWGRFVNADVYVDTEQYGFGSNMFTYCQNNPIKNYDPTGRYTASLVLGGSLIASMSGALTGIMTSISASMASIKAAIATSWFIPVCIAATAIAIAGIVYAVNRVIALSASAASTISAVKANVNKGGVKPGGSNTVYVITRKGTTDVVYAGRTCNFAARKSAHQKKFPSSSYTMYAVATGLTLAQARALEQTIITAYTIDTLKNMINSISPSKWSNFKTEFNQMGTLIQSWVDPE